MTLSLNINTPLCQVWLQKVEQFRRYSLEKIHTSTDGCRDSSITPNFLYGWGGGGMHACVRLCLCACTVLITMRFRGQSATQAYPARTIAKNNQHDDCDHSVERRVCKSGCWNPSRSQCHIKVLQPLLTVQDTSVWSWHMHIKHTHTNTHTYTHTHTHVCTNTHMHTHLHPHVCIHTCTSPPPTHTHRW